MSWTDEEIDKLVQESAGMHHVEYKDAYWKEMEAMLDQGKGRKGGIWWWMSCVVLLIGGATVMIALNSTTNSTKKNASNSNQPATIALATLDQKTQTIASELEIVSAEVDNKLTPTVFDQANILDKQNRMTQFSRRNVNTSGKKQMIQPSGSQINLENFDFDLNNPKFGLVQLNEAEMEGIGSETDDHSEVVKARSNSQLLVSNLDQNPLLSSFYGNLEPMNDLPIFPRTRIGFYAGVNAGIGQSYLVTRTNNDMYQVGVDAGLEVYKGKWVFGAGLGLKQQYARNLDLKSSRQFYSYGLIDVNSNLKYDQLFFVDLNLNVSYSVGKSTFGVVLTPNYLLGARLSYDQTTKETVGNETHILSKVDESHKYVSSQNFRQFGINTGITYSYTLPRNYLIQAELSTRLGNKILNTAFEGKNNNLPLMFELGIKKRF